MAILAVDQYRSYLWYHIMKEVVIIAWQSNVTIFYATIVTHTIYFLLEALRVRIIHLDQKVVLFLLPTRIVVVEVYISTDYVDA